jgi:FlaA1/EpsC-like NDP-sugar epimerase
MNKNREMTAHLYRLSHLRNRYLLAFDLSALLLAPAIAIWIRLEDLGAIQSLFFPLVFYALLMACLKMFIHIKAGLYDHYWAYASSEELATLLSAMGVAFSVELLVAFLFLFPLGLVPRGFPHSVPVLNGILTLMMISGSRMAMRLFFGLYTRHRKHEGLIPVLIAGAGGAGTMIVKELQANPHLGMIPVGYVDDNPTKIGKIIHGVKVLGPLKKIPEIVMRRPITEVIVAMPTAPGGVVRSVNRLCREAGIDSKTVPGLSEILSGSARVQQIRKIQLEDLLRRGTIETDQTQVGHLLKGTRVMVTGAGGSIGGELCRQIKTFAPAEMILLGHGENSIFTIEKELKEQRLPGLAIHSVIADIRDRDRLSQVFKYYQPQVVFHAAAHKHVGLMENNMPDAVSNNVLGTRNLVDLADEHGVDRFVMISSDKAVNPTSVMGVTKRIAELVVRDAAVGSRCAFVTVRFGNVLGSRGSVVPIFRHQIDMGGPVLVTHPDVKRFFMTIPEAVQLVLQAGTMGDGGEVFVLDMGEQIKVADIARELIRLSDLEEDKDIVIRYTGLLPGEKMYEELFYEEEKAVRTVHDKILMYQNERNGESLRGPGPGGASRQDRPLRVVIETLIAAAQQGDIDVAARLLLKIVPQYNPPVANEPAAVPLTPTAERREAALVQTLAR